MNDQSQKVTHPMLALSLLMAASLACNNVMNLIQPGGEATNPPAFVATAGQGQPSNTPEPTNTPVPPTETSTVAPTATPTATPQPVGLSRSNPYPPSELGSSAIRDVQVLEVKRGEEAWVDIQAANTITDAAPDGMEYLIVRLHVINNRTDVEEVTISPINFSVTGDRFIRYENMVIVGFDPELRREVPKGGESEGWVFYVVPQGEENMILVSEGLFGADDDNVRFFALEEGASIGIPPELASIEPTDLGKEQNNPASGADTVTTEDWEISVIEVIRGDEAWIMVLDANMFNPLPLEGLEYLLVKIHARYIGTEDKSETPLYSFSTIGSAGVPYEHPFVIPPAPIFELLLYPGGVHEGWIVVQAGKGETGVVLVFAPAFDEGDPNRRYISLEP